MEAFANALSVVMLLGGGFFLIKGEITMGEYVAISGLIWGIANPVRNLGIYANSKPSGRLPKKSLSSFLSFVMLYIYKDM
jgi:ABC-type bacteriocin/lantibiotic exporter with double-glycine peptidase domain